MKRPQPTALRLLFCSAMSAVSSDPSQARSVVMSEFQLPPSVSPPPSRPLRPITAEDAVDIWIARWLRIPRRQLCRRYDCDPRRLYEIWEQVRFPESRKRAVAVFSHRYPGLIERIDYGPHRRTPRKAPPEQMHLFD